MRTLTPREIIDGLKRLGVISPCELSDCFMDYLRYCSLRNVAYSKNRPE